MLSAHEATDRLKRHAPALSMALAIHAAAAVAIHAGMQDARPPRKETLRTVVAELITLPRRIEQALPVPASVPRQAATAPVNTQPQPVPRAAVRTAEPAAPALASAPDASHAAQHAPAVPSAPVASAAPAPVTAPRYDAAYLNNPKPAYPLAARRMGEEGTVLLHVRVSAEGLPARIEVRTSSGSERLDDAARNAVAQWRFVPARQGEESVAAWVLVPLVFRMNG
jgi:periplasmic protein TonB